MREMWKYRHPFDLVLACAPFIVGLLFFSLGLFGQTAATPVDSYKDIPPHEVPHCSLRGGPGSAKCRCLGMVGDVQMAKTIACWENAGVLIARDSDGQPMMILLPDVTPGIMQCMEKVPDHCEIVAKQPWVWHYTGQNTCRTNCKPENCGCADQGCKAHGPGIYGQSEEGFSNDGVPDYE